MQWTDEYIQKPISEVVAEIREAPTMGKKGSLYCHYFHLIADASWEELVSSGAVDIVTGLASVGEPVDVCSLFCTPERSADLMDRRGKCSNNGS